MNKWIEHDRGLAVNLYLIGKMLHLSKAEVIKMLKDSYDCELTADFVNEKRKWIASILGLEQYY